MSLDETENLGLDRLLEGQAEGENSYNNAMNILDTLVDAAIIDRDLATPPGDPGNGDVYLIAASATDDWNGHDGELTSYHDGWIFITVKEGFVIWVKDEDVYLIYDGSVWKSIMQETGREDFAKPVQAGATTILAGKAANGNSAPDDQPEYPANVRCTLAGSGGSTDVVVTITGVLADGSADTEEITVNGADANYDGNKAFATISDVAYTGPDWDGGTVTFYNGTKLGLSCNNAASIYKETFNGANQTIGTFNATYVTYIPTGVPDGTKALELWYKTNQFV